MTTTVDRTLPATSANTTPLYRVNRWRNPAIAVGATTIGVTLAAAVTAVTNPAMFYPAAGIALMFALVFAAFLAGFEYREKHPVFTDRI